MNDKEFEKLKKHFQDRFTEAGLDYKTFDLEHEIDRTIQYSEALGELNEKLESIIPSEDEIKEFVESETKFKIQERDYKEKYLTDRRILDRNVLEKFKTIAIYGDSGSGKTALAFKIIEQFKDRQIFFVRHPKPEIIKLFGYANIRSLEELEQLEDCIIYFDEPQLSLSLYDNHANRIISKLCSLARQKNIKLIISSNDTRVFGRANEAYFDLWLIKDIDFSMCKQGSKIRKAIKDNSVFEPAGFRLEVDEFLVENRKYSELNGKHKFTTAKVWRDELSRVYRNSQRNSQKGSQ